MTQTAETERLNDHDRDILRALAERKMAIAEDPVNVERRAAWHRLDRGDADRRPMILAELAGIRDSRRWQTPEDLACRDEWARGVEASLRAEIYTFEELRDDHVVEPWMNLRWRVGNSGYGVEVVQHHSDADVTLGARRWDPPIQDLETDLEKLQPRRWHVDREATAAARQRLERVLGDICPVRLRCKPWWSMGMTNTAINLIGLENLMIFMYDSPEGLHRLMQFLHDDYRDSLAWFQEEGLLTLDNENDYIGSGSMGYTDDLPQPDFDGEHVRLRDLWCLSESQETVGVGPEQFAEFIFPYQKDLADRFGKCYYGCCEPVHNRWHVLKGLENLARVSVSPWCDQAFMAEACGESIVFSRKPSPTLVSTGTFDEEAIREDLRETLRHAGNCRLEIVMKDVHTLNEEPDRLPRWVAMAREECGAG